jgi:RES domain-containing protein
MRVFRIADSRFPIFDGTGVRISGGRWNAPGRPVIYTAETFAGAMLEILVHANLSRLPKRYVYIEITIPDEVFIQSATGEGMALFEPDGQERSMEFGNRWLVDGRSAVLVVPSAVTGGIETNALINPAHPDFALIRASDPKAVLWDSRFFSSDWLTQGRYR